MKLKMWERVIEALHLIGSFFTPWRRARTEDKATESMHSSVVLYDYAMTFVGKPYRWGGDDTINGFDCSGLVIELLQSVGIFPKGHDATADTLYAMFSRAKVQKPDFGTLVFYGKSRRATHVGFCLNNKLVLEAGGGGSKTKTRADAAAQNAYIRIRPITDRSDLLGYCHPRYPWKGV